MTETNEIDKKESKSTEEEVKILYGGILFSLSPIFWIQDYVFELYNYERTRVSDQQY